jgi:hypothetical protein
MSKEKLKKEENMEDKEIYNFTILKRNKNPNKRNPVKTCHRETNYFLNLRKT